MKFGVKKDRCKYGNKLIGVRCFSPEIFFCLTVIKHIFILRSQHF